MANKAERLKQPYTGAEGIHAHHCAALEVPKGGRRAWFRARHFMKLPPYFTVQQRRDDLLSLIEEFPSTFKL